MKRLTILAIVAALAIPVSAAAARSHAASSLGLYTSKPTAAGVITSSIGEASWKAPRTALNEGNQTYEYAQPESYLRERVTKPLALIDFTSSGLPTGATITSVCVSFTLLTYPEALFAHWNRLDLLYDGTPIGPLASWTEEPFTRLTRERECGAGPWANYAGLTVAALNEGRIGVAYRSENVTGPGFASVGANGFLLEVN